MGKENICLMVGQIEPYLTDTHTDNYGGIPDEDLEAVLSASRILVDKLEDCYLCFECGDKIIHVVDDSSDDLINT